MAPGGDLRLRQSGCAPQAFGWRALAREVWGRPHLMDPRVALAGAAEFWETLSYAVIWLCGWVAIGLCFR
jgi:hypothetical protein